MQNIVIIAGTWTDVILYIVFRYQYYWMKWNMWNMYVLMWRAIILDKREGVSR